jgi:pilus assembly protein Flp/PilA
MKTLMQWVRRFVREEEGTEVVEWTLVAGLVVLAAAGAWLAVGGNVETVINALDSSTSSAASAVTP